MRGICVALCCGPFFVLGSMLSGTTANAAEEVGLGIAYDPRAPLGPFRDVAPEPELAGMQAKWDYFALDELSIGFSIQYNQFRRGPPSPTWPGNNGSPSAPTFRNVSMWSFLPTARYYFSTSALRPYVEVGAGLSNATGAVLEQDLSRRDVNRGFIVQPSVGLLVRLWEDEGPAVTDIDYRRPTRESMFGVTASFTYAFTTADVGGARNVAYAGFQLGLYAKP